MEPSDRKNPLLDPIRRIATLQQLRQMSDRELLAQFAGQGNEAAFRVLMDRYGSMVLRICKRILGNDHDAEDAFQATFVVLTSEAGAQRWQESVAAWLHGVAVRVAGNARRAAQRRYLHERQAVEKKTTDPVTEVSMREACSLLDEELARLPEKYRIPLIQCELMARRQDEIARELNCFLRTLTLRLQKGKTLLQKRLTARGVSVTVLMLSLMLKPASEAAAVSPTLVAITLGAVLRFTSGQQAVAASPAATHLAGQVIKSMLLAKIRGRAIAVLFVLGLTGGGLGIWQVCAPKAEHASQDVVSRPTDETQAVTVDGGKTARPDAPGSNAGPTALIRGKVLDAAGRAVPRAAVTALVRRAFQPGEHGLRDEVVARGKTDEKGVFLLPVPADFPTWFPERQVILVAKAPGLAPLTKIVRLAEQETTEVDLRLTAVERVVRGRLLDPTGAGARGVRLRVIRLGDVAYETVQRVAVQESQNLGWPAPVLSDAEGRFALSGVDPVQGVWLQVEDDRYAPDAFGLRGADQPSEIHLKAAQVLEGRILAADTGKAVAGVKLTTRLPGPYLILARVPVPDYLSVATRVVPSGSLDGVSAADGRFQFQSPTGAKTILDVHPPTDSPYLAVWREVDWPEGVVLQRLAVILPRGVVVRGRVVDQDGAPVAGASVQFNGPPLNNPTSRLDVIQGCAWIVLADKDGRFSLTVLAGPVRLAAHGPTHEYRPQALRYWSVLENADEPARWGWREPLPMERRFYTHADQELQLTLAENPPEVQLRLVRGLTVAGRIVGSKGVPVQTSMLLCGEKVSPLMNGEMQPLPVREGRYELPGCVPGRVYPVLFLDAVNGWGAAVDLRAGRAGAEVKLARCGSARVRLLDAKGQPLAGRGLWLMLLTEQSFVASQPPLKREADGHMSVCYDPRHYATDPVSDGEGWLMLPALIPGARYVLQYAEVKGVLRQTPEFRVEPGEQLQLPDLAIRDDQPVLHGPP